MQKQFVLRVCAAALLVMLFTTPGTAQQPAPANGRIVGRVLDAQTGNGLSAVTVQVAGTSIGTMSGVGGQFIISNVPSGAVTLTVSSLGYASKNISGVLVEAGDVVEQNISLETEAVAIDAIEVTAAAERGSVNRALDQQRNATNIVNAVTSEQITRSPDSDAAQAVQRVSGVTVQDGKFVVVRGLGERYTTTSLNGARIPSPEPERKMVPLDLFPSSLLESITTSKTFTPDQSGDFSGAQVDIKMREFPVTRTRSLSTSFGWNSAASGRDVFGAPQTGSEWIGFAASARSVPSNVLAAGNFLGGVTQEDMNTFVNSFRNAWSADRATGTPVGSFAFSLGGNDPILGRRMGYVLSGTYSHSQEVRRDEIRALAQAAGDGLTQEVDRFSGQTGRTGVLWGGIFNASTLIGNSARIAMSVNYNRSADNEARYEIGTSENYGNLPLEITRLRYVERSVGSAQMLGEHELRDRHRITWAVTGSRVSRVEPDRSEFVYAIENDPKTGAALAPAWFATAGEGAVRTFGDLSEDAMEAKADYRFGLGRSGQSFFKFGGLYRTTSRDADNLVYSITAPLLSRASRELAPEQIFDGRFSGPGMNMFRVAPLSQGGSYQAEDRLLAGYAMAEIWVTDRVRAITGARVEQSDMRVVSEPTVGAAAETDPSFTDVLPSLALNVTLTNSQSLRLSASQTLSRPEYRELARVQYRDVLGAENVVGNPDLVRALIRNFDVRWELYPSSGEIFSIALFGKLFENPIERIYLGTSGTKVVTFMNAESATNYGVEFEARKRFGFLSESLENLTGFMNATVMKSEIDIGSASAGASKVNDKRPMVGQSPYVVNAGFTYSSLNGSTSVTMLYNIFGERIVSAATEPLPDVYERARSQLDFSLRFPFVSRISAKLDVKNILDSPYETRQGTVLREYYKGGRIFSTGFSWRM